MIDIGDSRRDDWNACPPGEVGAVVNRLRKRRRSRTLQKAALITTTLLVLIAVGTWSLGLFSPLEREIAGLKCSDVKALAAQYNSGDLDDDRAERMRRHVLACSLCRGHFPRILRDAEQKQAAVSVNGVSPVSDDVMKSRLLIAASSE